MGSKLKYIISNLSVNIQPPTNFFNIILFVSFVRFQHTYVHLKRCNIDIIIYILLCQNTSHQNLTFLEYLVIICLHPQLQNLSKVNYKHTTRPVQTGLNRSQDRNKPHKTSLPRFSPVFHRFPNLVDWSRSRSKPLEGKRPDWTGLPNTTCPCRCPLQLLHHPGLRLQVTSPRQWHG